MIYDRQDKKLMIDVRSEITGLQKYRRLNL